MMPQKKIRIYSIVSESLNPGERNRTSDFPDISRVHSPLYYARE